MSSSDESDYYPEIESLNISNDRYYQPVAGFKPRLAQSIEEFEIPKYGSSTIKHSLPAYDLWRPFFPTYLSEEKFRNFHRPKLRHYNTGPQARLRKPTYKTKPFPIKNLSRTIYRYQKKLRNNVIHAINSGMAREDITEKFLLIRKAKDLTAKRGELFLFEYSEEHPPILNQLGMASNIKTYIKPSTSSNLLKPIHKNQQLLLNQNNLPSSPSTITTANNDTTNQNATNLDAPGAIETNQSSCDKPLIGNYKIGSEVILSHDKPIYFNKMKAGQKQQFIENNLFRAPIYQHDIPSCDFIVVRTRNSIYIRTAQVIFTVGQTMPLIAIPEPTESAIGKFRLELSNYFVHRLFMESDTEPPAINLNLLSKLFPDYAAENLRKRITGNGSVRVQIGPQTLHARGTSKYGLISLLELRNSFKPEQYCASMSMLAARQRLRELNYTESMINPTNDAETEPEVLAAPWNTSKAVLGTMAGRCYMDLGKHLIDPTGCQREGFSCVIWSKSPTEDQQLKERQSGSRSVTPTEKLSNIPTKNPHLYKIKREKLERLAIYENEAQRLASVQSNVLNSNEILSSDEEMDEDVEEENELENSFDEQLRDLDRLVVDGQTIQELNFEKEESERLKMMKEFHQNGTGVDPNIGKPDSQSGAVNEQPINVAAFKNKILKIIRTYNSDEGRIQRTELVRDPKIIALYIKQKSDSVNGSQTSYHNQTMDSGHITTNGDNLSRITDSSSIAKSRRNSVTLGPSELCRADGIILTISKKVLNHRAMRKTRRDTIRELSADSIN